MMMINAKAPGRANPRGFRFLVCMAVLSGLWLAAASRVHVNASTSDGAWGYFVLPLMGAPERGDLVLFDPPEAAGSPIPYMKSVRGLPGERVEVDAERRIRLNGALLGTAKRRALNGRALEAIKPVVIPQDHYYVHADHADSHDSRYRGDRAHPAGTHPGPRPGAARHPVAGTERAARETKGGAAMRRRLPFRFAAAAIACALTFAAGSGTAKNLGVRGAVWPIEEPDILAEIETRLEEMEASGELARMRREALARARERVEEPGRVFGVVPARERRTRLFDPSITIERDVLAHDGTLIAARGARLNPLETHPLTRDLLFIDGTRPVEVAWALRHEKPSVIVLLAGRPLDLARTRGRAFFFDQGGRLTRRFGLVATPSVVAAEGSFLRITEVPLEDEETPQNKGSRP